MQGESPRLQRMLSIFLAVITTMVVVFLAQIMLGVKSEIGEMKASLNALREQTAKRLVAAARPFEVLGQKCVDCHSERRFTGVHGSSFELKQVIKKMEAFPDANISAQDREKIHSSLVLLKCVRCHSDEQLKKFAQLTPERQRQLTMEMAEKPGSEISTEEANEILRVYQKIQGFYL